MPVADRALKTAERMPCARFTVAEAKILIAGPDEDAVRALHGG